MILKPLLFLPLRVGWKWRAARGTFQKWPNFAILTPDFTYFEALQIIFNVFTAIYMYYIPEKHRNSLKNIFPLASGVGWKWHKKCVADNSKTANLPFLTPDFPYNQGLLVIFNDFTEIYMYTILEIHKNYLQYLFLLATEGRVKMVRRAARGTTESNGRR